MKVSLVSPYPDITNYGLRTLSAVLREAGHDTTFICMPDFAGDGESAHTKMSEARYTDTAIDQMIETMRGSELVGITLMTHTQQLQPPLGRALVDLLRCLGASHTVLERALAKGGGQSQHRVARGDDRQLLGKNPGVGSWGGGGAARPRRI